jgi:4-amino-4-deoxy-L-arabinose transferase-like glycosyltransferase
MHPSTAARFRGALLFAIVAVLSVAYATPWAAPLRESARPMLPVAVVILGTVAGVWCLVTALLEGVSRKGGWNSAAVPLAFGMSSLCLALVHAPMGQVNGPPHDVPLVGAVLFAVIGLALMARASGRSELGRESPKQ